MPNRGQIERELWRWSKPLRGDVLAKTASFTTGNKESNQTYTNLGATGAITGTLNQNPPGKGVRHTFFVAATQRFSVDPGAAGGIYTRGKKQADDAALTCSQIGAFITLENDGNGDWVVIRQHGNWETTATVFNSAPVAECLADPTLGTYFCDDFVGHNVEHYTISADTGGTIAELATETSGVVRLLTDATDNDEISMQLGSATTAPFKFIASRPFWFEARIRTNTITDTKYPFFIGMSEEASAAAAMIGDTGAIGDIADKDWVGFFRTEADGDKLDTVHNTAGGTATEVAADAVTLVADTWINVGWYCDGTTVTFYADGVALATTVAIAAAEFPDGEELGPIIAVKNASAAAYQLDLDWWRALQLR